MSRIAPISARCAILLALWFAGCHGGDDHDKPHTDDSELDDTEGTDDTNPPADNDGDGYTSDEDCDDANAAVYPGAIELCDLVDNNCVDGVDEGLAACFYGADGNNSSLEDELALGTEGAPVEVVLDGPGRLALGAGEWFVSLRISADVTVEGVGADLTTLSGGALFSVFVVEDNPSVPYAVNINGLSIVDGFGSELHQDDARYPAGGALFCQSTSDDQTQVTMQDVEVSETIAERGGVIYSSGCDITINDSSFVGVSENTVTRLAGAIFLLGSETRLSNVSVTGFSVSQIGGAVYADLTSSFTMIDSVFTDNQATSGGGAIYSYGAIVCEGSTTTAGVRKNTVTREGANGGGVYLGDDLAATLTSTGCDWGSGGDDNSPDDVASDYFSGAQFSAESFYCDAYAGCEER